MDYEDFENWLYGIKNRTDKNTNLRRKEMEGDLMEKECFVLIYTCYSGENSISVFWSESDAYKAMIEELETEITNLQNSGYKFDSSENDESAEVHVPDSDIYYEWNIEESTIR